MTRLKLVRDKIPKLIKQEGKFAAACVYNLPTPLFVRALTAKMAEELLEFNAAESKDDKLEELADLQEVIDAYLEATGISPEMFKVIQDNKRYLKGGFSSRIYLTYTEEA